MVKIHGKEYMEVNERLRIFRSKYPDYALVTEIHELTDTRVVMKATIYGDAGQAIATGFAYEDKDSTNINKTSFIENCETSAWGRALANLGIGIDSAVASSDEVERAIDQQGKKAPENAPQGAEKPNTGTMSEKQSQFIIKIGTGLKDPYSPMTKSEVVELVRWKASQLGVDPKSRAVADAFLPTRDEQAEGLKPWEKFGTVLEEYLDYMQEQGKEQEPLFDMNGKDTGL